MLLHFPRESSQLQVLFQDHVLVSFSTSQALKHTPQGTGKAVLSQGKTEKHGFMPILQNSCGTVWIVPTKCVSGICGGLHSVGEGALPPPNTHETWEVSARNAWKAPCSQQSIDKVGEEPCAPGNPHSTPEQSSAEWRRLAQHSRAATQHLNQKWVSAVD